MSIEKKVAKLEKELAEIKKQISQPEIIETIEFKFQGKHYKISGDLGEMEWYDAKEKCEELGGQLPPRWLLTAIYDEPELKEVKKTFIQASYWSATENGTSYAWRQSFADGSQYYSSLNKDYTTYVRCVYGL